VKSVDIDELIRSRLEPTTAAVPELRVDLEDVVRRRRIRRVRRVATGAAGGLALLVALAVPLSLLSGLHPRDVPVATLPSGTPVPGRLDVVAHTFVQRGITDVAWGYGSVWVVGPQRVTRVDPRTGAILARIPVVTGESTALAVGARGVWIGGAHGTITRIDPFSNQVAARIVVDFAHDAPIEGVVVGAGWLWFCVPTDGSGWVGAIDPASNTPFDLRFETGGAPRRISFGFGSLWVSNTSSPSVVRVGPPPVTGVVSRTDVPGTVTIGAGSIWSVANDSVYRIDPTSGRVLVRIHVARASTAAYGDGYLWVQSSPPPSNPQLYEPIRGHLGSMVAIDPATNRIVSRPVPVGGIQPIALTTNAAGSAWLIDFDSGSLWRLDLRLPPAGAAGAGSSNHIPPRRRG
jgi:streptogramin lyase